jgi:hypothetical protein
MVRDATGPLDRSGQFLRSLRAAAFALWGNIRRQPGAPEIQ